MREEMREKPDCAYCEERRKQGANFCGRCGKQLKETPVIIDYKSLEKQSPAENK